MAEESLTVEDELSTQSYQEAVLSYSTGLGAAVQGGACLVLFRNALIHTRGIAIVAEVSSSTRRQVKFGTPSRPTALVGGAGMADVFVPTRSHEIERLLNDLVNGITDEAALQRFRELVSNFTSCDEPRGQGGAERKIADAVYTAVQLDPSQSMDTEHRRLEWSAAALFSSGFSEILAETLLRPLSEELGNRPL